MSLHPWVWRSLPLQGQSGSQIFERLFLSERLAVLLETPAPNSQPHCRYSLCAGSPRVTHQRPHLWTPPVGQILSCLRDRLQQAAHFQSGLPPHLPFLGGWLGWLGYDLAWEIERLPRYHLDPLPFPVAFWYEPASFALLDHQEQTLWLASSDRPTLERLHACLEAEPAPRPAPRPAPHPVDFLWSQGDYETAVQQAQKFIRSGDIFQANLSLRFQTRSTASPWQLYRALTQINPSPFASYWQTPWGNVISCSPERLLHHQGRTLQTRPIAGTRSRGATPTQDQAQARELLTNTKEQAEHIMLVDLARNDLGRVCQWGSVQVDEFLTIERYSHVMHLVSNIQGQLHHNCDAIAAIRALFPGGTITGCPKVRCLEIIETLEPWRRNLFYGACGYLDGRGHLDLNLLIRTLLAAPQPDGTQQIWGQVGAGIVADSDPQQEWYESLHKAQAQLNALQLAADASSATRRNQGPPPL